MSRSSSRWTRIGGFGLAAAALGGVMLVSPAASAAVAAERPDLYITEQGGSVLSLPAGATATTLLTEIDQEQSVWDTATAPNGDLWVAASDRVVQLPADGGDPVSYEGYANALGIAISDDGTVYVADEFAYSLWVQEEGATSPTQLAPINSPGQISLDSDGNVLVPSFQEGTISRVTPEGVVSEIVSGLQYPADVVEASDGSVVVPEQISGQIKQVSVDGSEVTVLGNVGSGALGLELGDDDTVYVNNYADNQLLSVPAEGGEASVVISGLQTAYGLARGDALKPQEIVFTSTAPTDATVGDTYTPVATGGESGNPVTFSIADSSSDVCSIDAETDEVTFDGPGTCTIAADQAGDDEYADAEHVTQDVVVNVPELFITGQVTSELPANEAGWYRTPATITYTCGGGTAPLVCPDPVTRANTQADFRAFAKVTDAEGRIARVRTPMKVDTTAPRLSVTTTGSGPYDRKARPIRCTATDKHSGIDGTCTVTYGRVTQGPNGGATRRWSATATDVAGNTKTISKAFRVKGSAPARPTMPGTMS